MNRNSLVICFVLLLGACGGKDNDKDKEKRYSERQVFDGELKSSNGRKKSVVLVKNEFCRSKGVLQCYGSEPNGVCDEDGFVRRLDPQCFYSDCESEDRWGPEPDPEDWHLYPHYVNQTGTFCR